MTTKARTIGIIAGGMAAGAALFQFGGGPKLVESMFASTVEIRMQIVNAGTNVQIFFSTNARSYILEGSANAGSNWYGINDARYNRCYTHTNADGSVVLTNCYFVVIHPKGPPTEIYRLRKGF